MENQKIQNIGPQKPKKEGRKGLVSAIIIFVCSLIILGCGITSLSLYFVNGKTKNGSLIAGILLLVSGVVFLGLGIYSLIKVNKNKKI